MRERTRMGHDSSRAALIDQHATSGADRYIAQALSEQIAAEQEKPRTRAGEDRGRPGGRRGAIRSRGAGGPTVPRDVPSARAVVADCAHGREPKVNKHVQDGRPGEDRRPPVEDWPQVASDRVARAPNDWHMTTESVREDLHVPDRFEALKEAGSGSLRTIVVPVAKALSIIDSRFVDMRAARRGSLLILRGDAGSGKSTFLDTVYLFRQQVITHHVTAGDDVKRALSKLGAARTPRIVVLDGREALGQVSAAAIEAAMHAINTFVRSEEGRDTLIVWPTNTDELTSLLVGLAQNLGAEALFGVGEPYTQFSGPDRSDFVNIAGRTVAALNEGASLATLGISEEHANSLAAGAQTIGRYMALVRHALLQNQRNVRGLLKTEQFRLWTVVIGGNEPEGDVAALTRGGYAYVDIDRLITATGANIVAELKKSPERLGILGSMLDARIAYMDTVTVLSIVRRYGDKSLHNLMKAAGMSVSADRKAATRVTASELGVLISGRSLGVRKTGGKAGSSTQAAFRNLAEIARRYDGLLNRALGTALKSTGLILDFETERSFGADPRYVTDLYCVRADGPLRIEVMWRTAVGRADIANYVLTKLGNYGRAIGLVG